MVSLHIRQLIEMKLTVMFRISRCGTVPKIMQINAGILKKRDLNAVASLDYASKNRVVELSLGGATYFINLFNVDLTGVFRTTQCTSVPKITQTASGV